MLTTRHTMHIHFEVMGENVDKQKDTINKLIDMITEHDNIKVLYLEGSVK